MKFLNFTGLKTFLNNLKNLFVTQDDYNENVDTINQTMSSMKKDITTNKNGIDQHQTTINSMQEGIVGLGNRVTNLEGKNYFTGQVGNVQSEPGVYLGLDTNVTAPNANMAIVSANSAAYIDMGKPNDDYSFRIIKWSGLSDEAAQFTYSGSDGRGAATITVPRRSGEIALTSDIQALRAEVSNILTSAPTAPNTSGILKFVVLSSEPSTKYDGYLYLITS